MVGRVSDPADSRSGLEGRINDSDGRAEQGMFLRERAEKPGGQATVTVDGGADGERSLFLVFPSHRCTPARQASNGTTRATGTS